MTVSEIKTELDSVPNKEEKPKKKKKIKKEEKTKILTLAWEKNKTEGGEK